jgi:hypothetical protein
MEGSMLQAASRLVLVAGTVALGAAGAMALRADLLIGYGFSRAFEARDGTPSLAAATSVTPSYRAEVGDEAYWLMRGGIASPALFGKRLVVGDRILITAQDGRPRHLEVVAIQYVGTPILKVANSPAAVRLMRVTFRIVDPAARDKNELAHVLIELEMPKPAALRGQDGPLGPT